MMIRFVVIGHRATTSSDFGLNDLAGSTGRLDILLRCVNTAFFLSNDLRRNVEIHLVLQGPPNPPKTIRLLGSDIKYLNPDERSTAALIRSALSLNGEGEARSSPGIHVSSRSYVDVASLLARHSQFYYLKESGHDIRKLPSFEEDVTFFLGDDQDLTPEEEGVLAEYEPVRTSLGPLSLHADHCITLVHNEMDRRTQGHS